MTWPAWLLRRRLARVLSLDDFEHVARLASDGVTPPLWLLNTFLRTLRRHGMPYFENMVAGPGAPLLARTHAPHDMGPRAVSPLHVLPETRAGVGDLPLKPDGGVRRGTDIVKPWRSAPTSSSSDGHSTTPLPSRAKGLPQQRGMPL
jgi:hypothetical protein